MIALNNWLKYYRRRLVTIKIVVGNPLDAFDKGEVDMIGHVVNCQGVMGSGIAKSIRERYPLVYTLYKEFHGKFSDRSEVLGCAQPVYLPDCTSVWNLFAQHKYGSTTRDLNYGAMGKALMEMADDLDVDSKIGFPFKMGSDRAKGDWNIVLEMIEFYFKDHDVTVYKLEG